MIISPRYKLIFVHIPKTGGGMVSQWLRKNDPEANTIGSAHVGLNYAKNLPPEYKIFTVFRDPFELYIFDYAWLVLENNWQIEGKAFDGYLKATIEKSKFKQFHYIHHPDHPRVFVLFRDRLQAGFSELIGESVSMPKTRKTHWPGEYNKQDWYNDAQRRLVSIAHRPAIEFIKRHENDNVVEVKTDEL